MDVNAMLSFFDLWTVLVLATVYLAASWFLSTTKMYPPGPWPLPLVGNILSVVHPSGFLHVVDQAAEKYGPITMMWLGSQPIVFLNTYDLVKEAYLSKADMFSDRPYPYIATQIIGPNPRGVLLNRGDAHKTMRRFTLTALHEFGLGKQSLEEKMQEEAGVLVQVLEDTQGKPIQTIKQLLQMGISNVIISICFGNRLPYGDKDFLELMQSLKDFFARSPVFQPENFFPILRYIPINKGYGKIVDAQDNMKQYVRQQIASHRATFDCENIRDFVDLYLKAEKDKDKHCDVENLFRTIVDLFGAGSETTATTLSWTFLFLIKNPKIQDKVQKEIDSVLGRDRLPTIKDKDKLVYVDAVMHEVWRLGSIAPLGAPRTVHEPINIGGYTIPINAFVFPNIRRIHMDKEYWQDPDVFRPERWIDSEGRLKRHDKYLPFSVGKRSCLGETFATVETFIFLTMLLQRFTLAIPAGQSAPSGKEVFGITLAPGEYELCAVSRD